MLVTIATTFYSVAIISIWHACKPGGGGTDSLSVGSDCGTSCPPILGF